MRSKGSSHSSSLRVLVPRDLNGLQGQSVVRAKVLLVPRSNSVLRDCDALSPLG